MDRIEDSKYPELSESWAVSYPFCCRGRIEAWPNMTFAVTNIALSTFILGVLQHPLSLESTVYKVLVRVCL